MAVSQSDGRMKNVDPGAADFLKIHVSESAGRVEPLIEEAPIQGKQAKHVDDI